MLSSTRRRILITTSSVAAVVVLGVAAFSSIPDGPTASTSDGDAIEELADGRHGATDPGTRHARAELRDDAGAIGRAARIPAARASSVLSGLRPIVAEAVVGTEREPDELRAAVDQRVERLHTAADEIETVGGRTPPARPTALPSPGILPTLERASTIVDQAPDVADRLREAAADADAATDAALELNEAAADYAGSTSGLPTTDDTDELLAVWRAEQDQLEDYREAVAAVDHPALDAQAAAHLTLVDTLDAVAASAVTALEDEDVDTYNRLLDGYEDLVQDPIERLSASIEPSVDAAVEELEAAEDRTLGFRTELAELRDDAIRDT